ncbi:MAG: LLM class flavin-dependent oxidoreductase [Candidatus Dormibacteraeota bacterium]|nr:LLM class flavin-dependent oxidoreductase [Candidatus Dormibacteraeota bacterium]
MSHNDQTRFAISIPQFVTDGTFDPGAFRSYLTRAEELGFESAWTGEQVLGTMPHLGPIETMTYAAACTERLRLGCMMLVSPLYSPLHLAKSLSSLDQLSRGRIEVGVGTGGRFRKFSAFAVDPESLVARFTEGLQLIRAVWTQPRVDFQGRFWQMEDAAMEPKPFQKPSPPIWFGAGHPAALRRAVRLGDGFFGAGSSSTAQFVDQVSVVRQALAESGRDPAGFPIAKRVYIGVDDDAERARRRTAEALVDLYGYFGLPGLDRVAVAGSADDCIRGLREVAAAGAQLILLNPLFDDDEQMERLAAQVVPHLA